MSLTLLSILLFPLLLTLGFALALLVSALVFRGGFGSQIGRSGYAVYAVMLGLLAFFVTWRGDRIAERYDWFQSPFSLPPAAAAAVLVLAAGTGVLLFCGELYASVGIRRLARSVPRLGHPLMEGASPAMASMRPSFARFVPPAIMIAGAEELLWRGYLLHGSRFAWAWSAAVALVVSSASFGLNHYYFGARNVVFKTFDGAIWGLMLLASGSLWPPFVSHCAFNVCAWRRLSRGGSPADPDLVHRGQVQE